MQWPSRTADLGSVFSSIPPKAFDFMMDPGCSLPNAKRENLHGLPVKGLLEEYGSKASIRISVGETNQQIFQLISLLKVPYRPESWRLNRTRAARQKHLWNAALNLTTSYDHCDL